MMTSLLSQRLTVLMIRMVRMLWPQYWNQIWTCWERGTMKMEIVQMCSELQKRMLMMTLLVQNLQKLMRMRM